MDSGHIYSTAKLTGTRYSYLYQTDMSIQLDDWFGFNYIDYFVETVKLLKNKKITAKDITEPTIMVNIESIIRVHNEPRLGLIGKIKIPVSNEVNKRINEARLFMAPQTETNKVLDYFIFMAKKAGYFFALPYDEILENPQCGLTKNDLIEAEKDGYLRTRIFGNSYKKLAEISTKFKSFKALSEELENII